MASSSWSHFVAEMTFYQRHKDYCIDPAHPGNAHNPTTTKNISLISDLVTELITLSRKLGGHTLGGLKALSLYYLHYYYHYFCSTPIDINNA